jgi:hypothetical protein
VLRAPRNDQGIALKHAFLRSEIERSLSKPEQSEYFRPGETFQNSQIVAIRPEFLESIQNRIVDFLSELEVSASVEEQLDHDSADPYFVCLMVSGRREYNGRLLRRKECATRTPTALRNEDA